MSGRQAHVVVYAVIGGWRYKLVEADGHAHLCPELFHSDLEASGAAYMAYRKDKIPIQIVR